MGGRVPWLHALAPKSVEEETFYIKGSSERRPDGPCGEPDQARPVKRSGENRSVSYAPFRFALFPGVPVFSRRPSAVPVALFPFPVASRARSAGRARGTTPLPRRPACGRDSACPFDSFPALTPLVRGARPRTLNPAASGRLRRGRRPPFAKEPRVFGKIDRRARDGANRAARAACLPVFSFSFSSSFFFLFSFFLF